MSQELDDLVGAVAKNDVFALETEFLRDGRAQVITAAVGVELSAFQGDAHGGDVPWARGREGFSLEASLMILSGGDAEFAREVLDGLAGLVADEFAQLAGWHTARRRRTWWVIYKAKGRRQRGCGW